MPGTIGRTSTVMLVAATQAVCTAQPDAPDPAPAPYQGHRLVEASIETAAEMERMLEISGDCWACHPRPGVAERYGFRADWDRDCRHDFFDFLAFLEDFAAGAPGADLNVDGELDFQDFLEFQAIFEAER